MTEVIAIGLLFLHFFVSIFLFSLPFLGVKYLLDQIGGRK